MSKYGQKRIKKMHKRNNTGPYAPHVRLIRGYLCASIILFIVAIIIA